MTTLLKAARKLSLSALIALGTLSAPAAAEPATGAASALVEVDNSILLENTQGLQFGMIAAGASGGTVTIAPASDVSSAVGTINLFGVLRHRAEFVSRAPLGTVMVMMLDPSVTLTHSGGVATMTASLTRSNGPGLVTATVHGLPIGIQATAAEQHIYVGGSLTVPAGQLEGAYAGEFDLTVNHL